MYWSEIIDCCIDKPSATESLTCTGRYRAEGQLFCEQSKKLQETRFLHIFQFAFMLFQTQTIKFFIDVFFSQFYITNLYIVNVYIVLGFSYIWASNIMENGKLYTREHSR